MPFKPCSSFVVSGATKSGKTWWVYRLLCEQVGIFVPNPPASILCCYGVYQPLFNNIKITFGNYIRFVEGFVSWRSPSTLQSDFGDRMNNMNAFCASMIVPILEKFTRNKVVVDAMDKLWDMDLIYLTYVSKYNDGYLFILAIDHRHIFEICVGGSDQI